MYVQYSISINLPTLIMHSGQTADPLNRFAKAMKEISSKRKKVEADFEQLARIEFEAGLYTNKQGEVVIPGRVFEAVIAEGAKKSREGKAALSSTFVDNDAVITYEGGPMTVAELVESEDHRLAVPVRVGQAKVIRTRPIFRDVKATFLVSLETSLANEAQLKRWVEDALNQVGIGDWRPRHGRGYITEFAEVRQPIKAVA